MRNKGLVACAAAIAITGAGAITGAAAATAGSPMPAGLIDADDAAQASLADAGRPGIRLLPNLRVRLDMSDRIATIAHGIAPTNVSLIDIRKHRRSGMMADYFPVASSGFFISAGWRKSPSRTRWAPGSTSNSVQIFAPSISEPLRVVTNVARHSPAMTAGWSGLIGKDASIGFSAGAMQEHGRAMRVTSASFVRTMGNDAGWSRVGALAQVNVAVKF